MAIDMVVFMIEVPEFKRHGVCSMILDAYECVIHNKTAFTFCIMTL